MNKHNVINNLMLYIFFKGIHYSAMYNKNKVNF